MFDLGADGCSADTGAGFGRSLLGGVLDGQLQRTPVAVRPCLLSHGAILPD